MLKTPATQRPAVEPSAVSSPAFKPHPILFYCLALVLVALFIGMMALYFKTVYPNRSAPHAVEQDQLDKPAATR